MRSVAWRLLLAFVAVVAVGVGLVAYVANQATQQSFRTYVEMGGTMYASRVADSLADYYLSTKTWRGVEGELVSWQRTADDRLLVADDSGTVVADTDRQTLGRKAADLNLGEGTTITAAGQKVGTVYLLGSASGRAGMGPGMMMGRGNPRAGADGTVTQVAVDTPEQSFLDSVNRAIILGALAATLLAVGLSLLLTRQIVRPLQALEAGSSRISAGDLGHRVAVTSGDEIGGVARAFNAMAESLERDEVSRRHLLADIAHELRTPLTVIEGTADGILDGVLEPSPEQIGIIKEEAELLTKLVADLRDLSLAEAGQLRLDRQPVDVGEVVTRVARGFEPTARERGQTLTVAPTGSLPLVTVDATRIAQAVSNLISNAVRYTPTGGEIRVSVDPDQHNRDRILIVVADDGEGISPEDLPNVFERFYRADKSRSRRSGGSGLGLAIVKQLVEAHGGEVWVESERGKGSSFYISLPNV